MLRSIFLASLGLFSLPTLALRVIVQPTTSVGAPTTVIWAKDASDPSPLQNLRFVITVDGKDEPLVKSTITLNVNSEAGVNPGVSTLGRESFVFSKPGRFTVRAISDPDDRVLGTSNEVNVSPSSASVAAAPAAASVTSPTTVVSTKPSNKTPLIVGAIFGCLLFIALVVILVRFLLHRRKLQREEQRLSFRSDEMVQQRRPSLWPWPSRPQLDPSGSSVDIDVEAGRSDTVSNPFADPPSCSERPESMGEVAKPIFVNPFSDPPSKQQTTSPKELVQDTPTSTRPLPPASALDSPFITPSIQNPPLVPSSNLKPLRTAQLMGSRPRVRPSPITVSKPHLTAPSRALPQVPLSAPVHRSRFASDVDIPPSPLTPSRSKPDRLMDRRLEQVQAQLEVLRRRRQREGAVDEEVARKVEEDLERKAEWLKKEIVGGWASAVEKDPEHGLVVPTDK